MNTTITQNLKHAHITNAQYFLIRMLSAQSVKEERNYKFDIDGGIELIKPQQSNSASQIDNIIFDYYREFLHSIVLSRDSFKKNYEYLITNYPLILAELTIFTNLDNEDKLFLARALRKKAHITRVAMLIKFLLDSARPYRDKCDLYNKNPVEMPSHSGNTSCDKRYYGPHLGVSFAHLGFLAEVEHVENIINSIPSHQNQPQVSNKTFYLEPLTNYVAYKDLEPGAIRTNLSKKQITDNIGNEELKRLYNGEFIERYDNLALLTRNRIACVGNTYQATKLESTDPNSQSRLAILENTMASNGSILDKIRKIKREGKQAIGVHVRDGAYSGYTQAIRDSDINKYSKCLNRLVLEGYLVVRLGSAGRPFKERPFSNFIDLTEENITVTEQMLIMSELEFIIGTGSGISQWRHLFNKPIIFLNSAALPNSPFPSGCVHACKRIKDAKNAFKSRKDNLILLLKSTWNWIDPSECITRELSEDEIDSEILAYQKNYKSQSGWRTTHELLDKLGIYSGTTPDYYLTQATYEHLYALFKV